MEVVVTGIGLVSALGTSLEISWQRLLSGRCGIHQHQPFSALKSQPIGLIGNQPVELSELTQLVVAAAIEDAGLALPLPICGVVMGSSRSYQAAWEQLAQQEYSQKPLENWLETLPHTVATATARQIGSQAQVLAPMAACATGIWAIAQAMLLIKTGQCQRAIAGAVEAPITPLTLAGFNQMGALARTGAYPFDRHREGLVLAEGAAVVVLESAESAKQRSARIYGQILGFGCTADAYRAVTPEPEGKGAIAAIKQCLARSCLSPADIDYIHAHGTATQVNDYTESRVLQHIFPQGVPVSSTKGATGHTLGASGALGVAFCLQALQQQLLPPCVGLQVPEFDLDLVTTPRPSQVQKVLCLSLGFGGQNAAIALGNWQG